MKSLGNEIREARIQAGISQQGLAEQIGKSRNYIQKLEYGDRIPSLKTLSRLCVILGTTIRITVSPDGINIE